MRHRGAVAADRKTGDGAGVLLPIAAGARAWPVVRARDGLPARRQCPCRDRSRVRGGGDRARRVAEGSRRPGCARGLGARDDAGDRAARPGSAARPRAGRGRGTRLPRPPTGRARARRVRRFALVPDGHLQGALRRRSARRLLRGPPRSHARGPVRDLPPALLDEHVAVVGAGAAVPAPLPQRRDQHAPRQHRVDARARGAARRRAARPRARRVRLGLRDARQRRRAAHARRSRRPARDGDAPAARVAERLRARPGSARVPPLPRRVASSPGTGRRASSSPTGGWSAPRSTATGCVRFATRSPTTASSRAHPRPARSRCRTTRASAAASSARARCSRSTPPGAGSSSTRTSSARSPHVARTSAGSRLAGVSSLRASRCSRRRATFAHATSWPATPARTSRSC